MEKRNWKQLKGKTQELGCFECPLGNEIIHNEDGTDFIKTCNEETLLDESKQTQCKTDEIIRKKRVALVATAEKYIGAMEHMEPSKEAVHSACYLIIRLAEALAEQNKITNGEVEEHNAKMKELVNKIFKDKKEPTILQ